MKELKPLDGTDTVEFEVDDYFPWFGAPEQSSICDGPNFRVWVEYSNSTKRRSEVFEMDPEKIDLPSSVSSPH